MKSRDENKNSHSYNISSEHDIQFTAVVIITIKNEEGILKMYKVESTCPWRNIVIN